MGRGQSVGPVLEADTVSIVFFCVCHERHEIARKFMIHTLSQPKSDVLMNVPPHDPFVFSPVECSDCGCGSEFSGKTHFRRLGGGISVT